MPSRNMKVNPIKTLFVSQTRGSPGYTLMRRAVCLGREGTCAQDGLGSKGLHEDRGMRRLMLGKKQVIGVWSQR
jgi:hypothetical protein